MRSFKYHFAYKYFKFNCGKTEMFIGLSCNNELGETSYSVVSNLLFQDEYGDWGHAVGVGDSERAALDMFWKDLQQYFPNINFEELKNNVEEIIFPQRVLICKGNVVLFAHDDGYGEKTILTKNGTEKVCSDDLIKYIANNYGKYKKLSVPENDCEFLKQYGFFPTFISTYKEFNV